MDKIPTNFANYQSFLDFAHNSDDIIAQFDSNLRHVYVNPVITKVTGKDPNDFLGKTNEELGMPAENCAIWNNWISSTFKQGEAQDLEFEFASIDQGKGPRYFHAKSFPIRNESKDIQYVAVITRDVTDKKMELSRLIALTKQAAIGDLASGVAHEIRSPLTIVLGNLEVIRERHFQEINASETLCKKLEKVENAANRISAIISNLMAFAKEDLTQSRWEEALPAQILESAIKMNAEKFSQANIHLSQQVEYQGSILCKSLLLKEALQNLLKNSYESISLQGERWIKVKVAKKDLNLSIEIEDSGLAIPEIIQRKMFDPFYSTKAIGLHQGLGLSVARGMIESMNGALKYDSHSVNPKFIIQLPMKHGQEF